MTWRLAPISEFGTFRARWRGLNEAGPDTILLDPDFLEPLIAEFATGEELVGVRGDEDDPDAMGLFTRQGRFSWQTFQPANAPLGAWVQPADTALGPLILGLLQALPGMPLLLGVSQQDPDLMVRPEPTPRLGTADYIETPRLSVNGEFDAYWAGRSKNFRRDMTRQRNRLERDGIITRPEILTDAAGMARAVADFARLETAGWKGRARRAVEPDGRQARFYTTMLKNFAERGEARVYEYFFDDRLVASDLCIGRDGTLVVLKTAHDGSRKGYSPAQLMRREMFGAIFDESDVRTIEFYGRVMDWHRRWTDDVRTMYHVNCYRWRGLSHLHGTKRS